jgi:hypothetical protein
MTKEFQFFLYDDPEQYSWVMLDTVEATLADICNEFEISISDIEAHRILETTE